MVYGPKKESSLDLKWVMICSSSLCTQTYSTNGFQFSLCYRSLMRFTSTNRKVWATMVDMAHPLPPPLFTALEDQSSGAFTNKWVMMPWSLVRCTPTCEHGDSHAYPNLLGIKRLCWCWCSFTRTQTMPISNWFSSAEALLWKAWTAQYSSKN